MNQPAVAFPRAPHPSQASGPNPGAGLVASPFEPGGPGGPDDLGRSWLGRFLIALAACLAAPSKESFGRARELLGFSPRRSDLPTLIEDALRSRVGRGTDSPS